MNDNALDQILTQRREAKREIVNVDEPVVKLVIFALSGERFALPGERVREILAGAQVFFVPGCPASLEGVINVRGDIESVVRLNELLRLPASSEDTASSILLCVVRRWRHDQRCSGRQGYRCRRCAAKQPAGAIGQPARSLACHRHGSAQFRRRGGGLLVCEASHVRALRSSTKGAPAAESLLGLPVAGGAYQTLLIKSKEDQSWPLAVRPPMSLRPLPAADIHPLPDLLAARCRLPGLRALALVDGQLAPVVDPRAWCDSPGA